MRIARRKSASPRGDLLENARVWSADSGQAGSGPPFFTQSSATSHRRGEVSWSLDTCWLHHSTRCPREVSGLLWEVIVWRAAQLGRDIRSPTLTTAGLMHVAVSTSRTSPDPWGVCVYIIYGRAALASCWLRKSTERGPSAHRPVVLSRGVATILLEWQPKVHARRCRHSVDIRAICRAWVCDMPALGMLHVSIKDVS